MTPPLPEKQSTGIDKPGSGGVKFLEDTLSALKENGLYREWKVIEGPPEAWLTWQGRRYRNFSSNNYLGLAKHPRVLEAAAQALMRYGAGATSSRLISGTLDLHRELEETLARFKGTEDCLVFPTGYMTNVGTIPALVGPGDAVIADRLNHASILDGVKLSGARLFVYGHKDTEALERLLKRAKNYKKKLVVTDSLFSMDGDLAPLPQIEELTHRHGGWLMIDEAHATGVLGEQGRGAAEHFALEGKIDIMMGTLSKALGSLGGFVCGSTPLIDLLRNKARSFIYTTALNPASCGAALASLALVREEPERREKLMRSAVRLRQSLKRLGLDSMGSESQIIPVFLGNIDRALGTAKILEEEGVFAPAIRPPTVPADQCRIRISLTADHTDEDVNALEAALMSLSQTHVQ